jgi:hypothetical protein
MAARVLPFGGDVFRKFAVFFRRFGARLRVNSADEEARED